VGYESKDLKEQYFIQTGLSKGE